MLFDNFMASLSFLRRLSRQRMLNCLMFLNMKSLSHLGLETTDEIISAKNETDETESR